MPITQERMLALIAASDDLRECWEGLSANAMELIQSIQRSAGKEHGITLAQVEESLLQTYVMCQPDYQHGLTLATEKTHFKLKRGDNDANRRRLRRRRSLARGEDPDEADMPRDWESEPGRQTRALPRAPGPPQRKRPKTATTTKEDQTTIELGEAPDLGGDDSEGGGFAL